MLWFLLSTISLSCIPLRGFLPCGERRLGLDLPWNWLTIGLIYGDLAINFHCCRLSIFSSEKRKQLTLTFAVGLVVSDRRAGNGLAVGRDAPTISCRLMALVELMQRNWLLVTRTKSMIFLRTHLNFREPPVFVAFGNERLASGRRFFA